MKDYVRVKMYVDGGDFTLIKKKNGKEKKGKFWLF